MLQVPMISSSFAQEIPDWIKTNAGWWAEGIITDDDFIQGIQFLIKEGILKVPSAQAGSEESAEMPQWFKTNAGWWSQGIVSDSEFISSIQYLMKIGVITVGADYPAAEKESSVDSVLESLEAELDACQEITITYKRLDCEKEVKEKMNYYWYKNNSDVYQIGPITFYYPGLGTEGNDFFMQGDQPILTVRILVENSGSDENVSMMCTGPAVCNYDVWDGTKAFKYSGMDFTNGQIVLKPGTKRVFNMLFGPNIGYGGTKFEYDSSKDYVFRVSEPWGRAEIPLNIK